MNPAIGEIAAEEIWKEPVDRILSRLAATAAGLNSAEVQSRLKTFGPNDAAVVKRSPLWLQFLSRFRNPLVIILHGAGGRRRRYRSPAAPGWPVVWVSGAAAAVLRLLIGTTLAYLAIAEITKHLFYGAKGITKRYFLTKIRSKASDPIESLRDCKSEDDLAPAYRYFPSLSRQSRVRY